MPWSGGKIKVAVSVSAACPTTPAPGASKSLVGTFKINPGSYGTGKGASGSWFRMVLPGGTASGGAFFTNPDSTASDKTYTLFNPGTDGGLQFSEFGAPAADTVTFISIGFLDEDDFSRVFAVNDALTLAACAARQS